MCTELNHCACIKKVGYHGDRKLSSTSLGTKTRRHVRLAIEDDNIDFMEGWLGNGKDKVFYDLDGNLVHQVVA